MAAPSVRWSISAIASARRTAAMVAAHAARPTGAALAGVFALAAIEPDYAAAGERSAGWITDLTARQAMTEGFLAEMDARNRQIIMRALADAPEAALVEWLDRQTGVRYILRLGQPFAAEGPSVCRTVTITRDSEKSIRRAYRLACRFAPPEATPAGGNGRAAESVIETKERR